MTLPEYSSRLDQLLRYIGGLLLTDNGTVEWEIGRHLVLLPDSARTGYIESLMDDHPETTREYEIGWDMWAIICGLPESEAAA